MSGDRTPWTVDVVDLLRHPGDPRHLTVRAPIEGLAVSSAAVPEGAEIVLDVDLEALNGVEIVAMGTIAAPWTGACRRCLEQIEERTTPSVHEVFARDHDEGETYPIGHDRIDLEPMVRDLVLLALPLAPLCREECDGPDPDRFPAVADDAPRQEAPADPRWAALDELRFDQD
jgi:uncharacterized protein